MSPSDGAPGTLRAGMVEAIRQVPAAQWNQLIPDGNPFIAHEHLSALEDCGCLGESFGWYPRHVLIHDAADLLIGAMPLYVKTNSYGEFVFDWSWASAYERQGLAYYPKLVATTPYTPVTGPRLLTHPERDPDPIKEALIEAALHFAQKQSMSGLHWLFTQEGDTRRLSAHTEMLRLGCQYHWFNNDYSDFDQFLSALTSQKRKKIRRERARVREQGVHVRIVHGDEADEHLWTLTHRFYRDTFDRKMGIPTLTRDFFIRIGETMGDRIVLAVASEGERPVATAINFRSDRALFGRYWGCESEYHSLHFEACYYQGIEYSIRQGLERFEPGAQGEHKIARGFLPSPTWSAHWIADSRFQPALEAFCKRERLLMTEECASLARRSPYRDDTHPPAWSGRPESLNA